MRNIGSLVGLGIFGAVVGVTKLLEQRDRARRERDAMDRRLAEMGDLLEQTKQALEKAHKVDGSQMSTREVAELVVEKREQLRREERERAEAMRRREEVAAEIDRLFDSQSPSPA